MKKIFKRMHLGKSVIIITVDPPFDVLPSLSVIASDDYFIVYVSLWTFHASLHIKKKTTIY